MPDYNEDQVYGGGAASRVRNPAYGGDAKDLTGGLASAGANVARWFMNFPGASSPTPAPDPTPSMGRDAVMRTYEIRPMASPTPETISYPFNAPAFIPKRFDQRSDLLKDAEDSFYGGGQAPPRPTPTPTPTPRPAGLEVQNTPAVDPREMDDLTKKYGFNYG